MSSVGPQATPLAIVGIGCLFPKASGARAYWLNVKHGVDAIGPVPATHWNPADYLDPDPKSPDHTYAARGGFLDPIEFRPLDFGIAPNDLEAIDTSQMLGLFAAREALLDAGYGPDRAFDRNRVSVILGVTGTLELVIPLGARLGHPRWRKALKDAGIPDNKAEEIIRDIGDSYVGWQENSFPGLLGNVVAGRIANRLDLGGTNCVVDAACASSLSAIHLAGLELATGRSDMVVTGGVDAFNDIFMYMCFSKTPALSPTGDAKPFDANGDGTILGEGLGIVVIKRLADAQRDGDRIYAIIKGLGTSSDGKGNAIYAPSAAGQVKALREAYRLAGVTPDTIELVEAHGTGTCVGDAAEVEALTQVFREARSEGVWCTLGSVKSQIGHTKAAAGAAGLIKAALALHFKTLPSTNKVRKPIDGLKDSPFSINTERRPWVANPNHPRRAAVSAFGFGGSNFHCVLEEVTSHKSEVDWDGEIEIAAFSAPKVDSLLQQVEALSKTQAWNEIQQAALLSRTRFKVTDPVRLLLVLQRGSDNLLSLIKAVGAKLRAEPEARSWKLPEGAYFGQGSALGKLAVLFPGQGSQYPNMLRDLACLFPQIEDVLARSNSALSADRLSDRIYPPTAFTTEERASQEQCLRQTDIAQPAIGAVSLGALKVLESFGVVPDVCAGHSYGELPALYAAGCIDEEVLHAMSRLRGQLMASYRNGDAGGMIAILAPLATIETLVREESLDLVIANRNAPNQSVLSGRTAEIERAVECLHRRKMQHTRLSVAAAFHSPLVASAAKPFHESLVKVAIRPANRPVYSNTTGGIYPPDAESMRDLLASQLAAPVRFVEQIRRMADDGVRTFLEVGPGSTLTKLVSAILSHESTATDWDAFALDASAGKRAGTLDLAHTLAPLAARGHAVDLAPWQRTGAPVAVAQPERKGLVVPICGANYVAPKKSKKASPEPRPIVAAAISSKAVVQPTKPMIETNTSSNGHHVRELPSATTQASPAVLGQALQVTQQSLAAFQVLQEQTAQLHKQFLESQEAAQRTLQMLLEQQQSLLRGNPRVTSSPVSFAPPAAKKPGTNGTRHQSNGNHKPERLAPPSPAPQPTRERTRTIEAPTANRVNGVSASVAKNADVPSGNAASILLAVVAEKTGYPAEMLMPEMALDADLGIDSIKRVEIFSALQEKLPNAPIVKPEHLGSLHTLADVIAFLGAKVAARESESQASVGVKPNASTLGTQVTEILFGVIAEKTGYPTEMLTPEMALDADLGIDSIKRVEIFSALQERLPDAPVVKPEHLGSLHTLADVVVFLNESATPVAIPQKKTADFSTSAKSLNGIQCSVLRAVPAPNGPCKRVQLASRSAIFIVGDSSPLCQSLCDAVKESGHSVVINSWTDVPHQSTVSYAGLILVAPQTTIADLPLLAFRWMKHLRSSLQSTAVFATITRLDGAFGLTAMAATVDPECGALAGLAKTAMHEWPSVNCKAIDVADRFPVERANEIWASILEIGPIELGFTESGRNELKLESRSIDAGAPRLESSDVILITGGARGVTAAAARALAERFQPTIVLLGRTDIDEQEPVWLRECKTEAAIKKSLAQHLKQPTPRSIEAGYRKIVASRDVRATLESLRSTGSRVVYFAADVTEADALGKTLHEIHSSVGPVNCLVHGAGVLADRRIEDLEDDAFASVYSTKVDGLKNILRELGSDPLKAIVLFSSSTGRFGRMGQAAYAAANEALNKIAQQQSRTRPDCKVVSINWGPWDGGMVTPALRKLFADEGVGVIPLQEGGEILLRELAAPKSDVEVTVIAQPTTDATIPDSSLVQTYERDVSLSNHPILRSHVINGRAVLPLALHLEWLAHGALHGNPGLVFHGVNDLRVLHGVQLDGEAIARIKVVSGKLRKHGHLFHVPVEMHGLRNGRDCIHSRGEIILTAKLPSSIAAGVNLVLPSPDFDSNEAYDRFLFHGPELQGIDAIHGIGPQGIFVYCHTAPAPSTWFKQPLRTAWLADPLVLDCAFQAMIVWSAVNYSAGCLPSYVGSFRQYRRVFPPGIMRIAVAITQKSGAIVRANIDFLDESGDVIARIENHESVIDDSLNLAFRHNRLNEEAVLAEGGVR